MRDAFRHPHREPIRHPGSFSARTWTRALISCALFLFGLEGRAIAREDPLEKTATFAVEGVTRGYFAARRGIQPGDELLSWEAGLSAEKPSFPPLSGTFEDPFDPVELEEELGTCMPVRLMVRRGETKVPIELPAGPWRLAFRPPMPPAATPEWERFRQALGTKNWAEVLPALERAADAARAEGNGVLAVWILTRGGSDLASAYRTAEARTALTKAEEWATALGRPLVLARVHQAAYRAAMSERRYGAAHSAAESAKKAEDAGGRNRISRVLAEQAQGTARFYQGDVPGSEPLLLGVLEALERRAGGTYAHASILSDLDILYQRKPDYAKGTAMAEKALAILEPTLPGIVEIAKLRGHLGIFATLRGDFETAETEFSRALAANEAIDPGSLGTAMALANLSRLVGSRGDLDTEEELLRRSLAIREKLGVPPGVLATIWTNLGGVATKRLDYVTAKEMYSRTLAIYEKETRESLNVVGTLYNLAACDLQLGKPDEATARLERALDIGMKVAPDSRETTSVLKKLGLIRLDAGDYAGAKAFLERALASDRKAAGGSTETALSLMHLAAVAEKTGDLAASEKLVRESIAITGRISPSTENHANAYHLLGRVLRASGRIDEALEAYRVAVEALEAQRGRLGGGSEADARFLASMMAVYADYLDLLLSLKRAEDAFLLLERSRARALLAMLAERDLVFSADVPKEVERKRRQLEVEYDRAQAELMKLSAGKDEEAIEKALARLGDVRSRQDEQVRELRKLSPRLAALHYPEPLSVREVQSVLDPGTTLVSYAFIPSGLAVFVLRGGKEPGFTWKVLPLTRQEAEKKVRAFRNLLVRPASGNVEISPALWRSARELNDELLAPVQGELNGAVRLLIIPDGPLRLLPFAALAREKANGAGLEFLNQWKPFHKAVSATVYAELKKGRRERKGGTARLVAFGDPVYGADPEGSLPLSLRSGAKDAASLPPLPSTRKEVESVAALFGKSATAYVGAAATEEAAKSVPRSTGYVHFACHGVLDEMFPLNSGLVLSLPKEVAAGTRENGVLQAWEVFQRVRIDSDLVVLSACETGLGMEGGGEGLIGLTRAFQYAGARTVLASLWGVSDESTLGLMKVFYREIRKGRPKDEALQAAQKALAARHPFFWAAFELEGDWR